MEQERKREASDKVAEPAGDEDEHSDAPGPHGTGEVYPRGDRPERDDRPEPDDRPEAGG